MAFLLAIPAVTAVVTAFVLSDGYASEPRFRTMRGPERAARANALRARAAERRAIENAIGPRAEALLFVSLLRSDVTP